MEDNNSKEFFGRLIDVSRRIKDAYDSLIFDELLKEHMDEYEQSRKDALESIYLLRDAEDSLYKIFDDEPNFLLKCNDMVRDYFSRQLNNNNNDDSYIINADYEQYLQVRIINGLAEYNWKHKLANSKDFLYTYLSNAGFSDEDISRIKNKFIPAFNIRMNYFVSNSLLHMRKYYPDSSASLTVNSFLGSYTNRVLESFVFENRTFTQDVFVNFKDAELGIDDTILQGCINEYVKYYVSQKITILSKVDNDEVALQYIASILGYIVLMDEKLYTCTMNAILTFEFKNNKYKGMLLKEISRINAYTKALFIGDSLTY